MEFKPASMSSSSKAAKADPSSNLAQRENFLPRGVQHAFALNSGP